MHTFLKMALSVVQLVACSHTQPVIGWHNLSLPLIGWHSCLLSVSIPALPPAQASTLHMLSSILRVGLTGTNFPSHFVQKIKSVAAYCTGAGQGITWNRLRQHGYKYKYSWRNVFPCSLVPNFQMGSCPTFSVDCKLMLMISTLSTKSKATQREASHLMTRGSGGNGKTNKGVNEYFFTLFREDTFNK